MEDPKLIAALIVGILALIKILERVFKKEDKSNEILKLLRTIHEKCILHSNVHIPEIRTQLKEINNLLTHLLITETKQLDQMDRLLDETRRISE